MSNDAELCVGSGCFNFQDIGGRSDWKNSCVLSCSGAGESGFPHDDRATWP